MKLRMGKRYYTARGTIEEVAGPCREHPEWFYTIQGNWYREDGRRITYLKDYDVKNRCIGGHHEPITMATGLDLIEEAPDETT